MVDFSSVKSSPASLFFEGAKDTFPLVVGAIPFGIIFGTLAETVGLSFYGTMGGALNLNNPYLIGAVAACVIGGLFKNLLLTIVLSMVVFLGAQCVFAMG